MTDYDIIVRVAVVQYLVVFLTAIIYAVATGAV